VADMEPIREVIYKHEAAGAVKAQKVPSVYEVVSAMIPAAHRPMNNLTSYPVKEVLEWQMFVVREGSPSSAAGAPQIIRKTLQSLVDQGKVGLNEIYNAETQDRCCDALIAGRGWNKFLKGEISAEQFGNELAKEWASFPVQWDQQGGDRWVRRGQSYYAGDGLNAASASPLEVVDALQECLETSAPVPRPTVPAAPAPDFSELADRVARLEYIIDRIRDAFDEDRGPT
jgi:hypothetical protein